VTRGTDAAVRGGADEVAEGSQELEENSGGISLGMWGKCTDEESGSPMQSRVSQCRRWGCGGSGRKDRQWLRVFLGTGFVELVFFLLPFLLLRKVNFLVSLFQVGCGECLRGLMAVLIIEEISTSALYGGEYRQRAGRVKWILSECHDMELPWF
jgi:hypothetical protein